MRKLVIILFALCGVCAPVVGQGAEPQVIPRNPKNADGPAIIIPAGSALRLASFPPEGTSATFRGRLTLTGRYKLTGYGDEAWVRLWPDSKSQAALPYWRNWWEGRPTEIFLENGWAFALAVVGKNELRKLKADTKHSVRGQLTIVVEGYETSIDCDVAHYSARFVSVVNPSIQVAANRPKEEEEKEC